LKKKQTVKGDAAGLLKRCAVRLKEAGVNVNILLFPSLLLFFSTVYSQEAPPQLTPDAPSLKAHLQLWLSADSLPLKDSTPLYRWADRSGNHRDAFPTQGMFEGGGTPPVYVKAGNVNGRPAIRFEENNGLGTSAELPVEINGDAAFTIVIVANLRRSELPGGSDVIVGFGEPLDSSNAAPGKPAAALLQIDRTPRGQHRLDLAGGFARDALIGRPGSFASFYTMPQIITLTKTPGSMRDTSSIFINGEAIDTAPASGTTAAPDIKHRRDFSVIIGHAFNVTGSILGDISEILIYNTALYPEQRRELESFLSQKYQIEIGPPLPSQELASTQKRAHWAYAKAKRPALPEINNADLKKLVRTPIDAFLLQKLESKGLRYSPEASPEILARRLALDLTGLPPTTEQLNQFLSDQSEGGYEAYVDELIASPHFGERWGRHWLDLAGYVDVNGNDQNAEQIILGESKWKYRDYVIRAFNSDKPFDQFLREQIAGDELVDWRHAAHLTPEMKDLLIATGYLRLAIDDTHEVDLNKVPFRYQVLFDTMQIVGNSLLGATVQCARCHDHKFDPIPQRDYYRMMALLTPTFNPYNWLQPKDRELPDVSPADQEAIKKHNAELDARLKPIREELDQLLAGVTNRYLDSKLKDLSEAERTNAIAAFKLPPEKRSDQQKALLRKHDLAASVSKQSLSTFFSSEEQAESKSLEKQIANLNKQHQHWDTIRAFFESGVPPRDFVFVRGDYERRSQRIEPGFPTVLCDSVEQSRVPAELNNQTSGRRLAFAKWLTNPNGRAAALTSRVIVNRFWQQLFGEGIVATPDNFGLNGARPTHPELLEWLVAEFIDSGWRVKPLIKMMVMSEAYRQSSTITQTSGQSSAASLDPEDKLLWRMRLRRLESEVIRDSILSVSGKLDPQMFGPAVPLQTLPDGSVALVPDDKLPTPSSKYRRTLYLMSRRNFHLPLLGSFDQPILNGSCARRMSSSVVLQPLTMLNDEFVIDQAGVLAQRLEHLCPQNEQDQIKQAFRLVFSRVPADEEVAWSKSFISDQAANLGVSANGPAKARQLAFANFCQMLLNTSEFLYVQ
jgi:hypothetical protein